MQSPLGPDPQAENATQSKHEPMQVEYPEIEEDIKPRHRFMSAFEQRVEVPDRAWQYLLVRLLSLSLCSPSSPLFSLD